MKNGVRTVRLRWLKPFVFKLSGVTHFLAHTRQADKIQKTIARDKPLPLSPSSLTQSHSLHLFFHLHDTSPLPPLPKAFPFPHPFPSSPFHSSPSLQIPSSPNPPFPYPLLPEQPTTTAARQSKLVKSTTKNPFPWRLQTPRN